MIQFIDFLVEARGTSPFKEKAKELYQYLKGIKGSKPNLNGSYEDKIKFTNIGEQKAEFEVSQYIKLDKSKATNLVDAPIDAEVEKTAKTMATILGIKSKPKISKKISSQFLAAFIRIIEYNDTTPEGYKIKYTVKLLSDENKIENRVNHNVILTGKKSEIKTSGFSDYPNIVPGTIFVASWGYDMTIVDYYQVVKRTGKSVYVQRIAVSKTGGGYSGEVSPVKDSFTSATTSRCVLKGDPNDKTNQSISIMVDDHYAKVWDGKAKYYNTVD